MKKAKIFLSNVWLILLFVLSGCFQDGEVKSTREGELIGAETPPTEVATTTAPIAEPEVTATFTPPALTPTDEVLLYDMETLAYWQTRYPISTRKIYDIGFLPYLDPAEKATLANIQLQFPLTAGAPYEYNPLTFYAFPDESTVVMPILSLKLLDDLSTAYAWLWHNGYDLETVTDYVAMLKYQPEAFRAGSFPPPLTALHIPDDALNDPEVNAMALAFFNEARAFILAHELGHILYDHGGNSIVSADVSQRHEQQADEFAMDLMIRTATQPMGAYLYFFTLAHWELNLGDFNNDRTAWEAHLAETTHPLTANRMAAMAKQLGDAAEIMAVGKPDPVTEEEVTLLIAASMAEVAEWLEDPEISLSIRLKGQATEVAYLMPRYPGEGPCETIDASVQRESMTFDGIYIADYIRYLADGGSETLPMCLLLNRKGDSVVGYFIFDLGEGGIVGQVVGEILVFQWQWGSFNGKGVLETHDNGDAIVGEWGYDQDTQGGGQWVGRRR